MINMDDEKLNEKTITVGELLEMLKLYDKNLPVFVYGVGITSQDSWISPIPFEEDSVDFWKGRVRISI